MAQEQENRNVHPPEQPEPAKTAQTAEAAVDTEETREEKAPRPEKAEKAEKTAKADAALAAAKEKLAEAEKQLAETKDALLRTAAEYDNFRKRSAKEHDAAFGNGVSFAVEKLLPVLDTLALAAGAETADERYKKGVMMTLSKCDEAFKAMGIEEIEALDAPFDPALHAAVMQQPAAEGVESGTVVQVLQKGYTLNGKVIRHAAVAVAE